MTGGWCRTDSVWSECDNAGSDWSESDNAGSDWSESEENKLQTGKWKQESDKWSHIVPSKRKKVVTSVWTGLFKDFESPLKIQE